MGADTITVSSLSVHLASGLGPSAFGLVPPPPCPVDLTLDLELHPSVVPHCVDTDDMAGLGVNYSSVSKAVYALLTSGRAWTSPAQLIDAVATVPLALPAVKAVTIRAALPRALLTARAADYSRTYINPSPTPKAISVADATLNSDSATIRDLQVNTIIGLHPHERAEKQRLEVDVSVRPLGKTFDHKKVADQTYDFLAKSSYGTLESLVDNLARFLLTLPQISATTSGSSPEVTATVRKPSALPFATPSITITRQRRDFDARGGVSLEAVKAASIRGIESAQSTAQAIASSSATSSTTKRIFIAVGSNIGDRVGHIRRAIRILEANGCKLVDTSRLYESDPMYVLDQETFINGVIEITSELSPLDLLRLLKRTENEIGRQKTFENGPRAIDLDLVLYGDEMVTVGEKGDAVDADGFGWLEVPHASVAEREFVLRPLADIDPTVIHPRLGETVSDLLAKVTPGGLAPIIPFTHPARPLRLTSTPAIMAIFNATPDSFSDGAVDRTRSSTAIERVNELMALRDPPDMIDIGGMSTRPGSEPCSEDEEMARVLSLVETIGASPNEALSSITLSVDTYRASVAAAAARSGISCINDVRGGQEPGMLAAMAAADMPVILMHSRGDSVTMTNADSHIYPTGVVSGVATELKERVSAALAAGVKRWDIILDPGLGFAKNYQQNLSLLANLPQLAKQLDGFPLLVGASRKGFVGTATGIKTACERYPGDAAVNSACTGSGVVNILRVHQPQEARETVRMAAAIRDAAE